jgi:hypothetical protein
MFARSTDGGKTFEKTINLSNSEEVSEKVQMDISGKNLYFVWWESGNYRASI